MCEQTGDIINKRGVLISIGHLAYNLVYYKAVTSKGFAMNDTEEFKNALNSFRENILSKVPHRINLVNILGANENAHTRILTEILRYSKGGVYPFLSSFLNKMIVYGAKPKIEHPIVETQRQYIDALIYEVGHYAIIIENKINRAMDQDKQIEHCIKAANVICKISPENNPYIWVIYLTDNGIKKADKASLTDEAKKLLNYVENKENSDEMNQKQSRYIEANYRDNILPWLKEEVLPECKHSEVELISMLQQYISYLESRFSTIRAHEDELFDKLISTLYKDESDTGKLYNNLKNLLTESQEYENKCTSPTLWDEASCNSQFSEAIQRKLLRMIATNYALDSCDALSAKINAVREWLILHKLDKNVYRSRQYRCVFLQYIIAGQRIKFQFCLEESGIWLLLFNNDYDFPNAKMISDLPKAKEKFLSLFEVRESENKSRLEVRLGEANSGSELIKLLDENKVAELVAIFHDELSSMTEN